MDKYKIYVGGEFIETKTNLTITNPYNKEIFAKTYLADKSDLEVAIQKAKAVEEQMKNLSSYEKSKILKQISTQLEINKKEFAEILSLESAKPFRYAIGEIERAIQTFTIASEEAKRLPKEYISLDWTPAGANKEGLVKYFPIGLVAGIAPFNFPLNLAVHKIAPAIAAGNPIILKPSRSTPLSTLKLAKIIDNTSLPKGALSILPMDREAGNQLVTDERIKLLSFTGSPPVGWKMKEQAGKKKILLELGGNAGLIVSETANIQKAVTRSIIGAFAYSGQVCIHTQRIYVHDKVFEQFTNTFIEATANLKFGEPINPNTEISAMIDEENAIRVEQWVNEAAENGAKILYGGKRNETYFEPTIITNSNNTMKVCSAEVFGPVVIIEKINSCEDGIKALNDTAFGLQAGIYTDSIDEMNLAFNKLEVGGVIINDVPTFRVDNMPYGGIKDSGLGREGVKYSIAEMMEPKLLVK